MKVIIPAAGVGTRLRPHTHTIPKPLLHVAGKPILGHILDRVEKLDPEETHIITGFMGDKIKEYVAEKYKPKTNFIEQKKLSGLGYAVHLALEQIDAGPVLIILGDTVVETDMQAFLKSGDNVLGVLNVDDPKRFGIAELKDGIVVGLVEKPEQPKSNLAIIGLYYVSDSALLKKQLNRLISEDRRTRGEYQLTDALQGMIEDGVRFKPYTVSGWYDCGKRETLIATNRHLLDSLPAPRPIEGSLIIPPAYIATSAKIVGSIIGPYVSVSDEAVVQDSIIQNSIVGYQAEVYKARLTDSLIGHNARVMGEYRVLNVGDSSEIGYF